MMSDNEMDNTDRLFDAMNELCHDEPACDVVYALAMMYAKALKDQDEIDLKEAAKSFAEAVALELRYPKSRINLAVTSGDRK
jgi:hypothetical protein